MDKLQALTMPKWGMAMTEGKVVAWLKEPGSTVEVGEEVFEVETEKIVNVIESPGEGVMLRQVIELDGTCPVGGLVAVLGPAQTTPELLEDFVKAFQYRFIENHQSEEQVVPAAPTELRNDDRLVRYISQGEGATPALLIHGIGSDMNSWLFNQSELALERQVIALDLPGHGGSSKDLETGSLRELAAGAVDLLDDLGIDKVHLVGHSLGGSVATQLALQLPGRVRSLSLISNMGPGTVVCERFLEDFIGATRRRALKACMSQLVANPDMITRELLENILRIKRIEGVQETWNKIAEKAILRPQSNASVFDLSQLNIPVQVIFGAQDQIASAPNSDTVSDGVALHVIEDVGHIPHMEAASRVNTLLSDFLADN